MRQRACRWRAAVRRGGDAPPVGARRAGRHKRSRRPCSSRSPRGSTGSAKRAKSRRSAPYWAVSFSCALLQSVAALDEGALQSALERLADADLLFVRGRPPQATYRFKHALIQDAAYDSLLKSRRQALHRRAAEILVGQPSPRRPSRKSSPIISPGPASTNSRSNGGAKRAIRPCAARPSRRRSPISARRSPWRTKAAGPAARAAISKAEASQRVKLQNDYAQAVLWSKGYAADETKAAFERTRLVLSRRAPNFPLMGFLHFLVGFSGVGRAANSAWLGILPNVFFERRKPKDELPRPEWST